MMDRLRAALDAGDAEAALWVLADWIRGGKPAEATEHFEAICAALEEHPSLARFLGDLLRARLGSSTVGPALTESGIVSDTPFTAELVRRLVRRFLPELEAKDDLRSLVRRAFQGKDDHERLAQIPGALWSRFFAAIGVGTEPATTAVGPGLEAALRTLAHHIGSLGLHPQFTLRLPHVEDVDSPFLDLTDRVLVYVRYQARNGEDTGKAGARAELFDEALATVERCRREVEGLRASKGRHGTSLELTGITFRLRQLLDRLELLLTLTQPGAQIYEPLAQIICEIVRAEKTRNHIAPHLEARADLLAFQVVEHAARKGSKYITTGWRDYRAFFVASLGGGLIVSIFSLFKTMMGDLTLPLGVRALLYGLNYSACFILIYVTGAALATKQPAMTANTIAQALGERGQRTLERLESLVVRVWRSQFVSFAGNLAMALPIAMLWSQLFRSTVGAPLATDVEAVAMLRALHPWESGTVLFAAVAGVFLYLAGLLSGWVDNRNRYTKLPERVAEHRQLNRILGRHRSEKIAGYLDHNLGAIAGNVFLGFALGSTGTIGEILGLPIDIRHIAFASAELGTSLEILRPSSLVALWPIVVGVGVIGLVNFLVSFGLSMLTALESRNITWREMRTLLGHLAANFATRPFEWFFPPRAASQEEEASEPDKVD